MSDFRIECYVISEDMQDTKILNLNEKDMGKWREEIELRALSEYYNQTIKVLDEKIDFKKRFC